MRPSEGAHSSEVSAPQRSMMADRIGPVTTGRRVDLDEPDQVDDAGELLKRVVARK
jgi:hypothetical protein